MLLIFSACLKQWLERMNYQNDQCCPICRQPLYNVGNEDLSPNNQQEPQQPQQEPQPQQQEPQPQQPQPQPQQPQPQQPQQPIPAPNVVAPNNVRRRAVGDNVNILPRNCIL